MKKHRMPSYRFTKRQRKNWGSRQ